VLQGGCALLVAAALYLIRAGSPPQGSANGAAGPAATSVAGTSVAQAFRAHRSNVSVEAGGRVVRVLRDDREGSPHQRFIVRVGGGVSVLVAHNLDLAPRVPVSPGDSVTVRGEYEWNDKGGVIHWTHRDPDGRHDAGWIRHEGRLYQ
jgi:hypothetical protein